MSFTKLTAFAGCMATVAAHGYVSSIASGGTNTTGWLVSYFYQTPEPDSIGWADTATDLGYVAPDAYASGDIICHKNATNAALYATVAAGATIDFQWTTWPDSHKGPVITYMANCNGDCTTIDKTTLEFFKIGEAGLIDGSTVPGTYATDQMIANSNIWTETIPADLAAGDYVIRHEIIALHGAESVDGAQNYPQCLNLKVTGDGTLAPSGTLGEALYTETDPGISVNIYASMASYTIPGPAMYNATGAATGVAAATTAASSVVALTTSSVQSAVTSSVAVSSAAVAALSSSVSPSTTASTVAAATSAASSDDDDTCDA